MDKHNRYSAKREAEGLVRIHPYVHSEDAEPLLLLCTLIRIARERQSPLSLTVASAMVSDVDPETIPQKNPGKKQLALKLLNSPSMSVSESSEPVQEIEEKAQSADIPAQKREHTSPPAARSEPIKKPSKPF